MPLVDPLELDVMTSGVCLACLTFVAFPLDSGDEREARREARKLASDLWPRSPVVQAIVWRLVEQLVDDMRWRLIAK